MKPFLKEYDDGYVRAEVCSGRWVWRCHINEYEITERLGTDGNTILDESGEPVTKRTRHQRKMIIHDVPCVPRTTRNGTTTYTGATKAKARFKQWRAALLDAARSEYDEAVAKLAKAQFQYADVPVRQYMQEYLNECVDRGLEPSTVSGYQKSSRYIEQYFGDKRIADVTSDDLKLFEQWLDIVVGLAPTTRAKAIKLFKAAFDVHRAQIGTYPFDGMREWVPRASRPDPNPLTPESVARVVADVESGEPSPFLTAVGLALRTGMRQSEVCALKWEDVDMLTGEIHVCRAIGRAGGSHAAYLKKPKDTNRRSRKKSDPTRRIPGSQKVLELLVRRREQVRREMLEAHPGMDNDEVERSINGLYVCGPVDGRFYNPEILSREWRGYSRTLIGTKGRRPTFHHLRDTCATYLKDHTDFKTVALILGHEDAAFTMMYYADSTKETMCAAMAALDDAL